MPRNQDKSDSVAKTSVSEVQHANSDTEEAQQSGRSINASDLMASLKELKSDLKGGHNSLRQEINTLVKKLMSNSITFKRRVCPTESAKQSPKWGVWRSGQRRRLRCSLPVPNSTKPCKLN